MEKYITSIKDFVIESMRNDSQIQYQANVGKPEGCFKKGMIYLLGINTPIDFKKATQHFSNQSLVNNQDANGLLGLIAELEGNFSQAFHYYERAESGEKDSYLDKVIKGRNHLQNYLKKLDMPITNNKEISAILGDYSKGNASKVGACIKIAAICNDEQSCLEAAKCFYDSNDYISAVQWLQKGNIGLDNPLYAAINKSFEKSKETLLHSKEIKIIDLEDDSLLSSDDPTPFLNKVKKECEEASMKSSIEWKDKNRKHIGTLIRIQKEQEENERLEAEAAEAARRRRRKKIIKYSAIAAAILFFYIIGASGNDSEKANEQASAGDSLIENVEGIKQAGNNSYERILSNKKLSDSDLDGKSKKELELMRNTIYARHGYKFKRDDLIEYFSQFTWYSPKTSDMSSVYNEMSDIEKYNIDFIKKHE